MRFPAWRRRAPALSVAEVLEAATAWPSGDYRRWKELARLEEADHREVVVEAVRLLQSGDEARMVLGAEMLDGAVVNGHEKGPQRDDVVRALRDAVAPSRAPAVIAAALGTYAMVEPSDQGPLSSALVHRDPRVRQRAAGLLAVVDDLRAPVSPSERRLPQEVLRDLLEHDSDPGVREEAAASLQLIYTDLSSGSGTAAREVYEYLRPHGADALPGVRAAALSVAMDADEDARSLSVARLTRELNDPVVDWRLVSVIFAIDLDVQLSPEEVADLLGALGDLRDQDWPAVTGDPAEYPDEVDRRTRLDRAMYHVIQLR